VTGDFGGDGFEGPQLRPFDRLGRCRRGGGVAGGEDREEKKEERNETEEHLVETVGRSPVAASVD
jgi:hypothetical protein